MGTDVFAQAQSCSTVLDATEQEHLTGDIQGDLVDSQDFCALKSVSSDVTCDISDSQSDLSSPYSTDIDAPPGLPPPPPPGLEQEFEVARVDLPSWGCSK